MDHSSRALAVLCAAALGSLALPACADEGEPVPGHADACDTPQGPLLGCPPGSRADRFTAADACYRLVQCGAIPLERRNPEGMHVNDLAECMEMLDEFSPERLSFALRCAQAATCRELTAGLENPCFLFGDDPPPPS